MLRHYSDVEFRDRHTGMSCNTTQLVPRSLYALLGDEVPTANQPRPADTLHTRCITTNNVQNGPEMVTYATGGRRDEQR